MWTEAGSEPRSGLGALNAKSQQPQKGKEPGPNAELRPCQRIRRMFCNSKSFQRRPINFPGKYTYKNSYYC